MSGRALEHRAERQRPLGRNVDSRFLAKDVGIFLGLCVGLVLGWWNETGRLGLKVASHGGSVTVPLGNAARMELVLLAHVEECGLL